MLYNGCLVEGRRLQIVISHGLLDKPEERIPMSIIWLVPQFFLLAGLESYFEGSIKRLFSYQIPPSSIKVSQLFHGRNIGSRNYEWFSISLFSRKAQWERRKTKLVSGHFEQESFGQLLLDSSYIRCCKFFVHFGFNLYSESQVTTWGSRHPWRISCSW